jgi:hypothetical protein
MKIQVDPKKNNYIIRDIPNGLWDRVKHKAIDENITLKDLILRALENYCEKNDKEG